MPKGIYDRSKGGFGRPTQPVKERFWKNIEVKGPDECWEWNGQRDRYGYGKFKYKTDRWRDVKAHRLVWEFTMVLYLKVKVIMELLSDILFVIIHHAVIQNI